MTTILVVDDSEIDRAILKNILASYYNVIEANNGYAALEILNNPSLKIDGLICDITMPGLDGFSVVNLRNKNLHSRMPVFLISSETLKANVVKAANLGVAGFIKKPYNKELILSKMKETFATTISQPQEQNLGTKSATDAELKATMAYAEKLRRVYLTYLKTQKRTDEMYIRVSEVVHILLEAHFALKAPRDLSPEGVEIITLAAYFYDIGKIIIRDEYKQKKYSLSEMDNIPETHTFAGADIVSVNTSSSVAYFVKIASDMCMHHHERYDGRGLPHGLKDSINNIYTQMCSIAIDFCSKFFNDANIISLQAFNMAMNSILEDKEAYRPDVIDLLQNCQDDIVTYFQKKMK